MKKTFCDVCGAETESPIRVHCTIGPSNNPASRLGDVLSYSEVCVSCLAQWIMAHDGEFGDGVLTLYSCKQGLRPPGLVKEVE